MEAIVYICLFLLVIMFIGHGLWLVAAWLRVGVAFFVLCTIHRHLAFQAGSLYTMRRACLTIWQGTSIRDRTFSFK